MSAEHILWNSDKLFVILINDSMAINTLNKLTCSTWRIIQIHKGTMCGYHQYNQLCYKASSYNNANI